MSYRILQFTQYDGEDFNLTLIINTETNKKQIEQTEEVLERSSNLEGVIKFDTFVTPEEILDLIKAMKIVDKVFSPGCTADNVQVFVIDSTMHKFCVNLNQADFFYENFNYEKGIDVKQLFDEKPQPQENVDYRVVYENR